MNDPDISKRDSGTMSPEEFQRVLALEAELEKKLDPEKEGREYVDLMAAKGLSIVGASVADALGELETAIGKFLSLHHPNSVRAMRTCMLLVNAARILRTHVRGT